MANWMIWTLLQSGWLSLRQRCKWIDLERTTGKLISLMPSHLQHWLAFWQRLILMFVSILRQRLFVIDSQRFGHVISCLASLVECDGQRSGPVSIFLFAVASPL